MGPQDKLITSFNEIDFKKYKLPIICIYSNPKDYQDSFIARVFDVDKPTEYILMKSDLKAIRKEIPNGFSLVKRSPADDPKIVETWI